MAKETAAQRKIRISGLLAQYDAESRELRKLAKSVEALKAQIHEVPAGTYGEWIRSTGTPREIMDMAAVKEDFASRGTPMPMRMSAPPIVITHVADASR
jgi:hypothetical protein